MARLIPSVNPESIELKPERDVAIALVRDLPDECIVFHSYCWLRPERDYIGQPLREGEADFLVLDPRFGLLVIEVKGGRIRHRIENDEEIYYRLLRGNRTKRIKHPFEQAKGNLHAIKEILELGTEPYWFGGCYGYAVAFPDCTNEGQLPNDVDPHIVFFAEHLDDMDRAVRGALRKWNRLKSPSITADAMRRCREQLRPVFRLLPAKWRDIERDEVQLVRLTEQQQIALDGLRENTRLAIRGGAGTGKTMLALWRAVEFAREGSEVLLLCFNNWLADWLNNRADDELPASIRKLITISTFHALCRRFFIKADLPFRPPSSGHESTAFWGEEVPNKMFDYVLDQVREPRFDAIVVDEAQDFARDWWLVIESLEREPEGPLCIFFDPNQNLFAQEGVLPKTDAIYHLNINCRNTRMIHKFSMQFLDADIRSSEMVPDGIEPVNHSVSSEEEQRKKCDTVIKSWRNEYRITPERLAILSPVRRTHSCLADQTRVGGLEIIDDPAKWREAKGVLYSTISSFKGLEADAIVLLSSSCARDNSSFDRYVATSRAKHLLAVIDSSDHR